MFVIYVSSFANEMSAYTLCLKCNILKKCLLLYVMNKMLEILDKFVENKTY